MGNGNPLTPAEKWERATLANNFIFYKVMRHHPDACRELLELLLGIPIDHVVMSGEEVIDATPEAKAVRLDVYAKDSNRAFDLEMQVADTKELAERARYYQGIMDVDTLSKGETYRALRDSHVVFICMSDPIGGKLPVYTFENRCVEKPEIALGDRTYKHFFIAPACARMLEDEEQKAFFGLLTRGEALSGFTGRLKAFVDEAKQNVQWRSQFMTWERQQAYAYQSGREAGIAEGEARGEKRGITQGERNKALETARLMRANNMPLADIAKYTGLTEEEIAAL